MKRQICGIIGGMGPEASIHFTQLILKQVQASSDQDHIPYILFNNPQIPDRVGYALKTKSESPVPSIVATGKSLIAAGANYIVMPCNTSHIFYDEIQSQLDIEVIDMVQLAVQHIAKMFKAPKIGILATEATIKLELFQKAILKLLPESTFYIPSTEEQTKVSNAILAVKKGKKRMKEHNIINSAAISLNKKGAEIIISGCTEISLVLCTKQEQYILVEPMELLAYQIAERYFSGD